MSEEAREERETLGTVVTALGITAEATLLGVNRKQDKWEYDEWSVVLRNGTRTHVCASYKMGTGHRETKEVRNRWGRMEGWFRDPSKEYRCFRPLPPSAADVLGALLLDGQSAQESFEDFCSSMDYDTDSKRAEAIYRACLEAFRDMHNFLGSDYERCANAEW